MEIYCKGTPPPQEIAGLTKALVNHHFFPQESLKRVLFPWEEVASQWYPEIPMIPKEKEQFDPIRMKNPTILNDDILTKHEFMG